MNFVYCSVDAASYCNVIIDAAEILEPLVDKTEHIEEGEDITLTCVGVGRPPPLVEWRKFNRVFSSNMSVSTNEMNVTRVTIMLMLTRASREDSGVYMCFASNPLNIAVRNITLTVKCGYLSWK